VRVKDIRGPGRESVILAVGPVLGAAVGAITNLITSRWNWWLFFILVILISLAAGAAVLASSHHRESPEAPPGQNQARQRIRTLPPGSAVFVGRGPELSRFSEVVKSPVGRPAVYMIIGSPGSGKTELATQAGYRLAPRYPDGQLFLALRSHSGEASRVAVADLLVDALDAVSSDKSHNSLDAAQLSSRWRAVTSDKRFIIILDDVADATQVWPFMPNSPDCAVIVTSRENVRGVDPDVLIKLGELTTEEGELMIAEIIRRASQTVNSDMIRSLASIHHMPLALRHVADQLVAASEWGSAMPQTALGTSGDPVETFRRTVSSLTAAEKLVFRRAALYPGPHLSAVLAGVLADVSTADATAVLTALHRHGLIAKPDPYGYAFHDLVRALALEESQARDTEADKKAARERLFEYTLAELDELNTLINAPRPSDAVMWSASGMLGAGDEYEALAWLGNYFEDLRATTRLAIDQGWSGTWQLTNGLAYFMRIRRNIPQAIELMEAALLIALTNGEELGQAVCYSQIATLQRALSNYPSAEAYIGRALAIFSARNDVLGQARCYSELGHITHHLSRYTDSVNSTEQALARFREIGDRSGIANSEGALGMVNRLLGDYKSSRVHLDRALELYLELGNPRNQAWILIELGTIDRQTGRYDQARDRLTAAGELFDRTEDRSGHAWAERELGIVSRMTGDYGTAADQLSEALEVFTALGSKRNTADAYIELAALDRVRGSLTAARDEAHLALKIYLEIGNVRGAAWAELECGAIERLQGGPRAAEFFESAMATYQRIKDRSGLARAYLELGRVAAEHNELEAARERMSLALDFYREMGSPEAQVAEGMLAALPAPTQ
jgi:tetratricopeptide (TPR) repeat protein